MLSSLDPCSFFCSFFLIALCRDRLFEFVPGARHHNPHKLGKQEMAAVVACVSRGSLSDVRKFRLRKQAILHYECRFGSASR